MSEPCLIVNAVAELSDTATLMSVPSALIESRAMSPTLVMALSLKDVAPKDIVPVAVRLSEPISIAPKPDVIEPLSNAPTVVTLESVSKADSKYVSKSVSATCTIVPLSFTTTLSASANVVDVAEVPPSTMLSSAAVESTAASLVKSACTNPDTPSSKLSSAAVAVTAVLPNVSLLSGTTSPAAPPSIRSSAEASHCIYAEAVSPKNFTS